MPYFSYAAKDDTGAVIRRAEEAVDKRSLASALRASGLLVLKIREISSKEALSFGLASAWSPSWLLRTRSEDIETGLRQLASLLRSGISVFEALATVAEQSSRPRAACIWRRLSLEVGHGVSLYQAVSASRNVFTDYVCELVSVGETSGELDKALDRAAAHLEQRRAMFTSLRSTLAYPVFAVLSALCVSVYLVLGVLPRMRAFLETSGGMLPPSTLMLLRISDWFSDNGFVVAISAFIVCFALWLVGKTRSGAYAIGRMAVVLPGIGHVVKSLGTSIAARGMSVLLESGIPLVTTVKATGRLLRNAAQRRDFERLAERVMAGASLWQSLRGSRNFAPAFSRMLAVAEKSGTLSQTLAEVATYHEKDFTQAIKSLSTMLEPLAIIVAALLVGFVYSAFFLALFQVASGI